MKNNSIISVEVTDHKEVVFIVTNWLHGIPKEYDLELSFQANKSLMNISCF